MMSGFVNKENDPRSPSRVRFADQEENKRGFLPAVRELSWGEEGLTDISNSPEVHQKPLKTTSSPAPGTC